MTALNLILKTGHTPGTSNANCYLLYVTQFLYMNALKYLKKSKYFFLNPSFKF